MKGLVRSMSRGRPLRAGVQKLNIDLTNLAILVAGTTGIGFGTGVIRGLPEGNILLLGAVANMQWRHSSANAIATWTGSVGIGSAPNADTALAGSEVDIIASTTLAAATANVSPLIRAVNAAQAILDNTAADLELNMNLLVDDLSISGNVTFTVVQGFLSIAYMQLGDD